MTSGYSELRSKKVFELNTEFADVLNDDDVDSETGDFTAEEGEDDVMSRWDNLCESLQTLAARSAGPPPAVDALDEIAPSRRGSQVHCAVGPRSS